MEIQPIGSVGSLGSLGSAIATGGTSVAAGTGGDFGKALSDLIGRLSSVEQSTSDIVARAAAGDNVDIADVMIATQAEGLAFQVGLQVRNKLVEAYQEIFRMQV